MDGEVVYCYLPPGYVERDSDGQPLIARVEKPIYGIQQAGRRLQRMLFSWLKSQGFKQLDDSDACVFTREHNDGEILTIGVYVDKEPHAALHRQPERARRVVQPGAS